MKFEIDLSWSNNEEGSPRIRAILETGDDKLAMLSVPMTGEYRLDMAGSYNFFHSLTDILQERFCPDLAQAYKLESSPHGTIALVDTEEARNRQARYANKKPWEP